MRQACGSRTARSGGTVLRQGHEVTMPRSVPDGRRPRHRGRPWLSPSPAVWQRWFTAIVVALAVGAVMAAAWLLYLPDAAH